VAMEYKGLFLLGLTEFILPFVSISIPYIDSLFTVLYWLAAISFLLVGLSFLIGSIRYSKSIVRIGFGLGSFSWILLIFASIWGMLWNQEQLFMKILSILILSIMNYGEVSFYSRAEIFSYNQFHLMGFNTSLIHLVMTLTAIFFGILLTFKFDTLTSKKESFLKRTCPYCNKSIPIHSKKCKYCKMDFKIDQIFYDPEVELEKHCKNCNALIKGDASFCDSCKKKLERCKICKNFISEKDEASFCPICKSQFHQREFLEWVKVKASCPICKTNFSLGKFKDMRKKYI
jgi:hypothetical protein